MFRFATSYEEEPEYELYFNGGDEKLMEIETYTFSADEQFIGFKGDGIDPRKA